MDNNVLKSVYFERIINRNAHLSKNHSIRSQCGLGDFLYPITCKINRPRGRKAGTINKHLNTGTEYDIKVFRVEHIVKWIEKNRDCDIGRKTAKALWRSCGEDIREFDEVIWKV